MPVRESRAPSSRRYQVAESGKKVFSDFLIGFLEPYPDYRAQAESLDELVANLKDIYTEISSGLIETGKANIMEISV